jgi:hypothetical protein
MASFENLTPHCVWVYNIHDIIWEKASKGKSRREPSLREEGDLV